MLASLTLTDTQVEEIRQRVGEKLPDLSTLISLESVLKLVDAFGGQDVYVPLKANVDSRLKQVIGRKDLGILREHYKGSHIKIPRLLAVRLMLRNQKIVEARNNGASINKIAQEFDLTNRQILNILKRQRK